LDFPGLPIEQAGEIFEGEAQRCGQWW